MCTVSCELGLIGLFNWFPQIMTKHTYSSQNIKHTTYTPYMFQYGFTTAWNAPKDSLLDLLNKIKRRMFPKSVSNSSSLLSIHFTSSEWNTDHVIYLKWKYMVNLLGTGDNVPKMQQKKINNNWYNHADTIFISI